MNYETYKKETKEDIAQCLNQMKCQPILFIGSGLSIRYINAPDWAGLLTEMANQCPLINKSVNYYLQDGKELNEVGGIFAELYKEWAWDEGVKEFPSDFFQTKKYNADIYIKHNICEYLKGLLSSNWEDKLDDSLKHEISLLRKIAPHAVITTNYDCLIDKIFNNYEEIIGQQKILRGNPFSFGEIFKVHGSVNEPSSLVLTLKDYEIFSKKKKYLSAKLLTFFAEHPLLFIGYNVNDDNIKSILADIDEIISEENKIIPNIYFIEYDNTLTERSYPAKERVIPVGEKGIRIKTIFASKFDWIFESFINSEIMESIDPKLLRALLSRTYQLIVRDIPKKEKGAINFETLQRAVSSDNGLANLYGITMIDDSSKWSIEYCYCMSDIAERFGYKKTNHTHIQKLIKKIEADKGINIKKSDNKYHITNKNGINSKSTTHKYSEEAIILLEKVRDNLPYEVNV